MSNDVLSYPLALTKNCAMSLLEITEKCLHCNSEEDYKAIFILLNKLFPFDNATSGLAELNNNNDVTAYELLNISYPEEWIKIYNKQKFSDIDVIVRHNFSSFTPQYWDNTYKKDKPSQKFISLASDFNIKHGYTFGAKPFGFCTKASLFSFSGNFLTCSGEIIAILKAIIPQLHLASAQTIEKRNKQSHSKLLTKREKEILNWLKHGKSSWDISRIIGRSENTVNFHIYNIMKKLQVVNRPQAVAVATHLGLIDID